MADILCDFCGRPWTERRPMVEGHQGSCICGGCLTVAWTELVAHAGGEEPARGERCVLCLEEGREGGHWRSPVHDDKLACRRCVKQSASVLHQDPDIDWQRPSRDPG